MSSPISDNDIEAIRQLLKIVSENGLSELTYKVSDGVSVTIKCESASIAPAQQLAISAPSHQQHVTPRPMPVTTLPVASSAVPIKRGTPITSPATGIYYQSPSPGDPPFVKVGDTIKIGQVIGLLEAMKVFSDIHSDATGKVTELAATDGQLVRDGDPILFVA